MNSSEIREQRSDKMVVKDCYAAVNLLLRGSYWSASSSPTHTLSTLSLTLSHTLTHTVYSLSHSLAHTHTRAPTHAHTQCNRSLAVLFRDKGCYRASVSVHLLITLNLIGLYVNINMSQSDSTQQILQHCWMMWLTFLKCCLVKNSSS